MIIEIKYNEAYLCVKFNLSQVELRLGYEETAECVLRQELDDHVELASRVVGFCRVIDGHGEYVAQDTLAGSAARTDVEVLDNDAGTLAVMNGQ